MEPEVLQLEDSLDGDIDVLWDGGPPSIGSGADIAPPVAVTTPVSSKKKFSGKKPMTGYILYSSEMRRCVVANHPESSFGEISRIVGNDWRNLPAEEKQYWEEKSAKVNEENAAKAEEEATASSSSTIDTTPAASPTVAVITPISFKKKQLFTNADEPTQKKSKLQKKDDERETNGQYGVPCSEATTSDVFKNINISESPSKRQLKKLRKKEKWLAYKPVKRAKEKERLKQKKLDARLNNIRLGPSRKELKLSTMAQSNCRVRVAIDLSFDNLMNAQEISKCIKQLLHCYSLNRRAKDPMQFYITSFGEKSEAEMQKHTGYLNWDVNFHSESYLEIFESKDVVYLSSESDNIISSLEPDKVYIIGGLVDHNSHKGLCHQIAQDKGISHGQLPIGEFLEMKSRKVLTIDHVFQILLEVTSGKSWKDAFLRVIPSRKGVTEKTETELVSTESCIKEDSSVET